jgi:hypothetical protein
MTDKLIDYSKHGPHTEYFGDIVAQANLAIKLQQENAALKAELDKALCKGYELIGSDQCVDGYHIKQITVEELNKIKADAIRDFEVPEMDNAREWHYINDCKNEHANRIEAGE